MSKINAYFHCATCFNNGHADDIQVGAVDQHTLGVECGRCGKEVGQFKLAKPLPPMNCGACGKPLGLGHKH